jgi:hypothetical protein
MRQIALIRRFALAVAVMLVSACAGAAPSNPAPPTAPAVSGLAYADQPGEGNELKPGTYVTTAGPLRVAFTVPSGWFKGTIEHVVWESASNSSVAFTAPDNLFIDPCDTARGLRNPPVGPTVDDLVMALRDVPGATASAASDVTVAGYHGKKVELTGTESGSCDEGILWAVGDSIALSAGPGETVPMRIVDVRGARLVIASRTRPEITAEGEAQMEAIIESIQVEGP